MTTTFLENKIIESLPLNMQRVACIILCGGQGTRLFPLTKTRAKPAMPFGGKYRLIDVPISNALQSKYNKIFVISQFLAVSLHSHITKTYRLDSLGDGFIDLLSTEQKPNRNNWYMGTADAVKENLEHIVEVPADYFLILSGDHLYRMNYQLMVQCALETGADAIIAAQEVPESEAPRFGILKMDQNQRITDFCEKPKTEEQLEQIKSDDKFIGSMGIYLFKRDILIDILENNTYQDFGRDIIPALVSLGNVFCHVHQGYWEDIGTVASYYQANMNLTKPQPKFDFYSEQSPLLCQRSFLPSPKLYDTQVTNSIICDGSIIEAPEIINSIIGPRSVIKRGTIIHDSYIMGNDFYTPPIAANHLPDRIQIGKNCIIQKAIIDKNVCIGDRVTLMNKNNLQHYDSDSIFIRDGIIIVARGATIPDDFSL
jgi:glucose-1-phosphate adenylyltransferase